MGLLQHIQHQISAVNDLITVNNDRIASYTHASGSTNDADLQAVFSACINQSNAHIAQLNEVIHTLGGSPADGTSLTGKVSQTWSSLKAKITKQDRLAILNDCERGEDIAVTTYREALDDKELIWKDPDLVKLLTKQCASLKVSHDKIKALRDAAKPVVK